MVIIMHIEVKGLGPSGSISQLACGTHHRKVCFIDEINISLINTPRVNMIGRTMICSRLTVKTNGSCQTVILNPGANNLLQELHMYGIPVTFHDTDLGSSVGIQRMLATNLCAKTLHWIAHLNLVLTTEIKIVDGNLTDMSYITYQEGINLITLNVSNNQISNSVLYFTRFHNLKWLELSHNSLSFVQVVIMSSSLKLLDMSHNRLTALTLGLSISSDYSIDLSFNQLHDTSFLTTLSGTIEFINLSNNRIMDVSHLHHLTLQFPTTISLL